MTEFVLGKIKFTWKGNWAVSTAYEKDDIIKFGGNTYVCTTGHTTGGTIPDFYTDIAKWDIHVEGVTHKGDHADATFYKVNDIVKSGNNQYICTIQHTSTPTINLTNFTLYVQGGDVAAQSGKAGQFLSTDGTNTAWVDIVEAAPAALDTLNELAASLADDADFAGTMTTSLAGKEPTLTAGTVAQYYRGDKTWQTLPEEVAAQTSQSGKFLTTDGTDTSWADVDALPNQASQAGEFLTTDGTNASWEPIVTNPYDTATASTGYFDLPTGTTAQRPGTPATGNLRVNSELMQLEHYIDGTWVGFAGSVPTITGVSPTTSIAAGTNITITGVNFQSGSTVRLIGTDNSVHTPSAVTFVNSGQVDFVTPELPVEFEPYDVKLTLPSGGVAIQSNVLDAGGVPVWTTAAGSLGSIADTATGTHFTLVATDPDSQVVTFSMDTVHLNTLISAGLTLNGTSGAITGDPTNAPIGGSTLYSFDVKATDSTGVNITIRSFSITVDGVMNGASGGTITTYSSGGTNYKVHTFTTAGTTQVFNPGTHPGSIDIFAIAGGGGGGRVHTDQDTAQGGGGAGAAGVATGLALTTGNYTFDIGRGAYHAEADRIWKQWLAGSQGVLRCGVNGEDTVITDPTSTIMITLPGGGGGGRSDGNSAGTPPDGSNGRDGGCGGGGGSRNNPCNGGSSTKPTVSGWTTYGGGGGNGYAGAPNNGGGGGGGAGATGGNTGTGAGNGGNDMGGDGGIGIQNDFFNGSQIYYGGGGGGGSAAANHSQSAGGLGGGGKGTNNLNGGPNPAPVVEAGTENTGSGGGGSADPDSGPTPGSNWAGGGGSGIVVVRYQVA